MPNCEKCAGLEAVVGRLREIGSRVVLHAHQPSPARRWVTDMETALCDLREALKLTPAQALEDSKARVCQDCEAKRLAKQGGFDFSALRARKPKEGA